MKPNKSASKKWKKILKMFEYIFLLGIGGVMYCTVEILFRGFTDPSMFLVGGICFVSVGLINEWYPWDMPLISQMFISMCLITAMEYIAGVVLNIILKLNVWDYSNLPYNLSGQICLIFSIGWFFLSLVGIVADDWIRYLMFDEEKPRYHIFYSHCEDLHR